MLTATAESTVTIEFIWCLLAFLGGASLAYLAMKSRIRNAVLERELILQSEWGASISERERRITELETELLNAQATSAEKLELLGEAQQRLTETFRSLSADALVKNNQSFLELARATLEKHQSQAQLELEKRQQAVSELVRPLKESLEKMDGSVHELEKTRAAAYAGLVEQLRSLGDQQLRLQHETGNLVKALRAPTVRGRWGEIQLRRVVELAGMVAHCDFVEQESTTTEQGRLRPDMIINLPGGKQIIVDSKVPLSAYLESVEELVDEQRNELLNQHARQVRTHIVQLSQKGYWEQFETSPDFVVLFLPSETFFSAALEHDPTLIEFGMDRNVILVTPVTLIGLLKSVAYGWRQDQINNNAKEISRLGSELHDRVRTLATHFIEIRRGLEKSVEAYNKAVGSMEQRVLVTTRRFKELGAASSEEIPELEVVEQAPRQIAVQNDELWKS